MIPGGRKRLAANAVCQRSRLEKIDAILLRVLPGKRADLWNGLNKAFYWYWHARNWRKVPPVSEIEKRLASIGASGRRLLRHLGLGEEPRPFSETVESIPYLVRVTIEPAAERDAKSRGGFDDFPPRPYDPPTSL